MRKIRKGDKVIVLAGKAKGESGEISRINVTKNRAYVKGIKIKIFEKIKTTEYINDIKKIKIEKKLKGTKDFVIIKHVKPNPEKRIQGGRVEQEPSVHLSNLALYNPVTKKGDKVGIKKLEDGKKVRIFKSNGELVDI
jgi:large subunit ribosomal protein L24